MAERERSDRKRELMQTFQSAGLEDALKKEMRLKIIDKLHHFVPTNLQQTFETRVLASLISEYFTLNELNYSNSVFLPDSGYEGKVLTRQELCSLTNTNCSTIKTSILQSIISRYIPLSQEVTYFQRAVQTYDEEFPLTIEQKFSFLEEDYRSRLRNNQSREVQDIASLRREIELEFKDQYDRDLVRFKEFEMESIRISERERARKKYEQNLLKREEDYKRKIDELRKQSNSLYGQEEALRKELDHFSSNDKSLLNREKELLRVREMQIQQKGKLLDLTKNIEKDNVRKLQEQLTDKIREYDTLNVRATEKINYEVNVVRLALQKEYQDKQLEFLDRKKVVDEEYFRIDAVKESVSIIERENERLTGENLELRKLIQNYLSQINTLMADSKENNNRLDAVKDERERLQREVNGLQEKNSSLASRVHRLQHELTQARNDLDEARKAIPAHYEEEEEIQEVPVPISQGSSAMVDLLKKMDEISRNRRKDIQLLREDVSE